MSELTDLQAAVAANTAAIDASVSIHNADKATIAQQATHITDLQTQLDTANATIAAGAGDGAALQAMTTQLATDDAKLPTATGA